MKYIWRIIRFTGSLWPYYAAISAMSVAMALLTLVQPMLSGWAVDELQHGTGANFHNLFLIVVAIFISDTVFTVIANINGYVGDQMSVKLFKILGERYYQHLLSLPQQFFDTELTGKIINRLNRSINQLSNFMQMWSNNFLQFIFSTVFALAIVAHYSVPVALLLLSLYPIFIYMTVRTSGRWLKYQAKKNEHQDIASGRFAEAIGQIKVVKSFIREKHELKFFSKHVDIVNETNKPQSKFWHIKDVQRRFILNIIFFGVYFFIFWQAAHGHLTPGQAVALILYALQIRIPIFTISFLVDNTQRAVGDSKDYFEIMNMEPTIVDKQDATELKVNKGEITFDHVFFSYDKKDVLKDITVSVAPDTKVALVGESGEGKTTLTNLLMRLYEPQKGTIDIDGQHIADVTQSSLRKNIGVVFQDPALFSGTIRENIAYGRPHASTKEIEAAAKAANAHEFIHKFEKGYEAEIGERGLKLSGGQKQRIAIARALLKDAPILILDEATSSLDSKSEQMVQEALKRLMKGRTTLIIAHRLSTIQDVDEIITLSGGQVGEIGSPNELASSGGIYSQLLALQQGHTEATKKKLKEYGISS
jgi:ATP-binding cassette subfamily B protein